MNINEFALSIADREKGKRQVDIAQIKEILGIINKLTCGVLYSAIKLVSAIFILAVPLNAQEIINMAILDHVSPVTQFRNGRTEIALMDSVVQIGKYNGGSVIDLQVGVSGDTKPEPNEAQGIDYLVGALLKVNTLVKDRINFPAQWEFLRSIEHGPILTYNFRESEFYGGYQAGLAFSLNPKK